MSLALAVLSPRAVTPPTPRLPKVVEHRGLTVRFARGYENADALIEELICAETAPRQLTVVSSDHRLHRAARRRRARAVDSDGWYAEILRRRLDRRQSPPALPAKPHVPLSEAEVAAWLERFGGETALRQLVEAAEAEPEPRATGLPADAPPAADEASDKPTDEEAAAIGDPFPPGYAEDLLDELSDANSIDFFPPGYGEGDEET